MKRIIIVNNNMKIGGVQKSLCNLLWEIEKDYDITLLLFNKIGELVEHIPPSVKIIESKGLFRYLGVSQGECKENVKDYIVRGLLAFLTRLFGRRRITTLMCKRAPGLNENFDYAVSYLHNGRNKAFYGGTQEYVLKCISARKKVAFLHCDYLSSGANCKENNQLLGLFDTIVACSDGCKDSVGVALPDLMYKVETICNFHPFDEICNMSLENPLEYDGSYTNVIMVSRLSHEKGIERAIVSLAKAITRGCKVKLHIVGDGPMLSTLTDLVKEYHLDDNVVFYGAQQNPYRYMKNADLLLITSYHEAAPMVIDEAVCLGVPTLTVETTSSKDMVLDRGCGWVCKNTDDELNKAFEVVVSKKDELSRIKESLLEHKVNNDRAKEQFKKVFSNK